MSGQRLIILWSSKSGKQQFLKAPRIPEKTWSSKFGAGNLESKLFLIHASQEFQKELEKKEELN
jgi:hypothetical protein